MNDSENIDFETELEFNDGEPFVAMGRVTPAYDLHMIKPK